MKKQRPRISAAEWLVCQALWERGPQKANDIVAALANRTQWKPKTIRTLLNRLVKKGVAGYHKQGREYEYYSLISQSRCIREETRSFVERVFGGSARPMLAAFLEEKQLTPEEIAELKAMLEEKERGQK